MPYELTLDALDSTDLGTFYNAPAIDPETRHHAAIFPNGNMLISFTKSVESIPSNPEAARKADSAAKNSRIKPMGASGEGSITFEKDPKEGIKVSGSASVKYEDKNGNYARVEASKEKGGKESVKITAGKNDGKKVV
jgi:hypothetical protein